MNPKELNFHIFVELSSITKKGEKLEQRHVNASWGEVEVGHGQRGRNIEEWRRIKILG